MVYENSLEKLRTPKEGGEEREGREGGKATFLRKRFRHPILFTLSIYRRMVWVVQRSGRWPQAACPAGPADPACPYARFRGGPPAGRLRVGHGGPEVKL
jgi:hypothetical protein